MKNQLIKIDDPRIILNFRYSTTNNITNKAISEIKELYLAGEVALKFKKAVDHIYEHGYRVVVWDSYRTEETQHELQKVCQNENYVARHSNHCRGMAIDMTLANKNGNLLDMGTDFDDFTPKAASNAQNITDTQKQNRKVLKDAMEKNSFSQDEYEWWHFNFIN